MFGWLIIFFFSGRCPSVYRSQQYPSASSPQSTRWWNSQGCSSSQFCPRAVWRHYLSYPATFCSPGHCLSPGATPRSTISSTWLEIFGSPLSGWSSGAIWCGRTSGFLFEEISLVLPKQDLNYYEFATAKPWGYNDAGLPALIIKKTPNQIHCVHDGLN